MRRFRVFAAQSPAIVVSIIALTFSLGAGAYATSALDGRQIAVGSISGNRIVDHSIGARRLTANNVTWHALGLINGWHASLPYHTGSPSYAVSNGVVYLSGALHRTGLGPLNFAILPAGARPRHNIYVTVYTFEGSTGTLIIHSNGVMDTYSLPASNGEGFTSLATISFPLGS